MGVARFGVAEREFARAIEGLKLIWQGWDWLRSPVMVKNRDISR